MKQLFILGLAFILCLGMALGSVLFLSLLPHLNIIGWAVLSLLCTAIGCCVVLLINFTFTKISINHSHREHAQLMRNVVLFESGAAAYINGEFHHLSAEHQRAQVQLPATIVQSLPSPKKPEPWTDEATILELWQHGSTLETIVESTGMPYATVQKVTSTAKKNGVKRLPKSEVEQ